MILAGKIAIVFAIIIAATIGIAAAIVLSLITVYVPNHSVATSGIQLNSYIELEMPFHRSLCGSESIV